MIIKSTAELTFNHWLHHDTCSIVAKTLQSSRQWWNTIPPLYKSFSLSLSLFLSFFLSFFHSLSQPPFPFSISFLFIFIHTSPAPAPLYRFSSLPSRWAAATHTSITCRCIVPKQNLTVLTRFQKSLFFALSSSNEIYSSWVLVASRPIVRMTSLQEGRARRRKMEWGGWWDGEYDEHKLSRLKNWAVVINNNNSNISSSSSNND